PASCGPTNVFGVGWVIQFPPYVGHDGDLPGVSSSNTVFDGVAKMGAMAVTSTSGVPLTLIPKSTVPPASLTFNVDAIAQNLLDDGKAANNLTTWDGLALPTGVARVLFLSGKTPGKTDLAAFLPSFVSQHQLTANNVVDFLNGWHAVVGKCSTF